MINKSIIKNKKNIETIKKIHKSSKTYLIDDTNGQLETCFLAEKFIDKKTFIASCDYITIFNSNYWVKFIKTYNPDVVIWTYKLKDLKINNYSNFAYCKIKKK